MFLSQVQRLGQFHPAVYFHVRAFKEFYSSVPQTDRADVWVIGQKLRLGQLPTPFRLDQRCFALQRLTRLRVRLAKDYSREKNYFVIYVFPQFSGLTSEKPLSDIYGASAPALVTERYSVDDTTASLEPLAQLPRKSHKPH